MKIATVEVDCCVGSMFPGKHCPFVNVNDNNTHRYCTITKDKYKNSILDRELHMIKSSESVPDWCPLPDKKED